MVLNEHRAIASIAIIMCCRMLGLFMILPFFSVYAAHLPYATPLLIGIALGIYGLTQAIFQIPLGTLSDQIGRKKVITIGLLIFALGSLVAALSSSIYGIIAGRALQGAGAIGSTLLAMAADLTPDENRSKAMALLGLIIGISFFIAMIVGPLLNEWIHLSGIFWTIFILALIGIVLLHTLIPNPPSLFIPSTLGYQSNQFSTVLNNKQLLRLNLGIFCLHAMLTATFIAIPILLTRIIKLSQTEQIILYLCVMIFSFIFMLPFIILAEKKRKMRTIFISAIFILIICECILGIFQSSLIIITTSLLCFFTAFSLLEASLPSIVSKIAPIQRKGTAMGIYSTAQFFGIFVGGALGGLVFSHFHLLGLFLFCSVLGSVWLLFAITMQEPPYLSTCIFEIHKTGTSHFEKLQNTLMKLQGVSEVATISPEGLIYIKADHKIISKQQLRKIIDESNLPQ